MEQVDVYLSRFAKPEKEELERIRRTVLEKDYVLFFVTQSFAHPSKTRSPLATISWFDILKQKA